MRASSFGGRQAASDNAAGWAQKRAEQMERAKAIREQRKQEAAMRQAERDHVTAAAQAKIDRAQREEEERIAKLNQEPEMEIPAFLRGYKEDSKQFVGGGWNNNTDVVHNKHSSVDPYENKMPMKKSSSSQFSKPNMSAGRTKSSINRPPSGQVPKQGRN